MDKRVGGRAGSLREKGGNVFPGTGLETTKPPRCATPLRGEVRSGFAANKGELLSCAFLLIFYDLRTAYHNTE